MMFRGAVALRTMEDFLLPVGLASRTAAGGRKSVPAGDGLVKTRFGRPELRLSQGSSLDLDGGSRSVRDKRDPRKEKARPKARLPPLPLLPFPRKTSSRDFVHQ